jgi:hypothetical protein
LSTWITPPKEITMGEKENRAYKKLSARGRTAYGRDRAVEADANGGHFTATLNKLYAGHYNAM